MVIGIIPGKVIDLTDINRSQNEAEKEPLPIQLRLNDPSKFSLHHQLPIRASLNPITLLSSITRACFAHSIEGLRNHTQVVRVHWLGPTLDRTLQSMQSTHTAR